jgi:hypothetical protein
MGRLFGIVLIVLGVWAGLEIYNKGMDHAFGGVFAGWSQPIQSEGSMHHRTAVRRDSSSGDASSDPAPGPRGSIAQRVGVKVQGEINQAAERTNEDADPD